MSELKSRLVYQGTTWLTLRGRHNRDRAHIFDQHSLRPHFISLCGKIDPKDLHEVDCFKAKARRWMCKKCEAAWRRRVLAMNRKRHPKFSAREVDLITAQELGWDR